MPPEVPFRPSITSLPAYRPGRPIEELKEALGLHRVVKLASNEDPFGPLESAVAAVSQATPGLNRYPDGVGLRLREALGNRHGVDWSQIVLGNGADELIRLVALAAVESGDRVVFGTPSFPTYAVAARVVGAEGIAVPLVGNSYDLDRMLAAVDRRTRLVFVCTPNNPSGGSVVRSDLERFLDRLPAETVCVIDEAYFEFDDTPDKVDGAALVRSGRKSLVALRTFSKVYGLAALRIGYAVASPDAAAALERARNVFNVNTPAQDAALVSLLECDEDVRARAEFTRARRCDIFDALERAGLCPVPSQGNFVYADLCDAPFADGAELASALLAHGVMIRPLAAFGADQAVRVTVGTDSENKFFAEAIAEVCRLG